MADWFYYDIQNSKIGPITSAQLKSLAAKGVINPDTVIETDTGRKSTAGKIQGLVFLPLTQQPPAEALVIPDASKVPFTQLVREHLKKPGVITAFIAGMALMFVFDCIYCSTDFYRRRVAQSLWVDAMQAVYGDNTVHGDDKWMKTQSVVKIEKFDPGKPDGFPINHEHRLLFNQFEVQSMKAHFDKTGGLYFEAKVKNGTGKAVKAFVFFVKAQKKGRTVPIADWTPVGFTPKAGIEPNETVTLDGRRAYLGVAGEDLGDIEFTASLFQIDLFDGEIISAQ